ncbi:glycosyltransferase family 2 protein [Winogradskyella costae]|uniref:glycosyltransferase family 2 protein n=1 Tax=Winogradskyella costae TaxID=2697008 RepID=UPI0015C8636E|nr:glycosyltransferase family 2 protein [Winogradskyella costae]
MDISVVIPLLNERDSLKELHDWIVSVMLSNQFSYEILFIDDGSTDKSWQIISELGEINPKVKGIKFLKNFGKSQALHAGFAKAEGDVVITMDADLQDNPEEIPELFKMIKGDGFDLVSGWKKKRYDSYFSKNLPSKLFNWAARRTSGVTLNDFNCGLKAYSNTVVKHIDVYGEMHRYIPVLAKNAGFTNIGEKVVQHQARKYGHTKFGMNRFVNGFLDLITIWFVSHFGKRPMHLFGALGVIMFFIGFCFSFYLGMDKLFLNPAGRLITDRPQFYIALSTMIIGSQLFIAGFLGELILRSNRQQQRYFIKENLNLS